MRRRRKGRTFDAAATVCLLLLVALPGCKRSVAWWDAREQRQPLMQRAADKASQGDVDAAVRLYAQALEFDPKMARGHLDLALLYHDHLKDYVRAVYHYERYLELRPDSEKREMISSRVRLAKQAFAGALLQGKGVSAVRIAALEKENTELRQQAAEMEKELRRLRSRRPGDERDRVAAEEEATAAGRREDPAALARGAPADAAPTRSSGGIRTYRVNHGDTLTRIAQKVYGDGNRWRDIQKANQELLGRSNRLMVGHVLVIP